MCFLRNKKLFTEQVWGKKDMPASLKNGSCDNDTEAFLRFSILHVYVSVFILYPRRKQIHPHWFAMWEVNCRSVNGVIEQIQNPEKDWMCQCGGRPRWPQTESFQQLCAAVNERHKGKQVPHKCSVCVCNCVRQLEIEHPNMTAQKQQQNEWHHVHTVQKHPTLGL